MKNRYIRSNTCIYQIELIFTWVTQKNIWKLMKSLDYLCRTRKWPLHFDLCSQKKNTLNSRSFVNWVSQKKPPKKIHSEIHASNTASIFPSTYSQALFGTLSCFAFLSLEVSNTPLALTVLSSHSTYRPFKWFLKITPNPIYKNERERETPWPPWRGAERVETSAMVSGS